MTITTFIFDFDGTIADSFVALVKLCNQLADEFGYRAITDREIDHLRNLSSRQIIKESGVSILKLPLLIRRVKIELKGIVHELKPIEGMPEALRELKRYGYQLGILTSNQQNNVEAFLQANHMTDVFDFIYSGATIFGKSRLIRHCLQEHHLDPAQVVYVGDETRDIDAAQTVRMYSAAVAWGFNTSSVLATRHPDVLLETPQELLTLAQTLCPRDYGPKGMSLS